VNVTQEYDRLLFNKRLKQSLAFYFLIISKFGYLKLSPPLMIGIG